MACHTRGMDGHGVWIPNPEGSRHVSVIPVCEMNAFRTLFHGMLRSRSKWPFRGSKRP